MTRRRLLLANIRRVAIRAAARLLELRQFVFDRSDLRVRSLLVVLVAGRARSYRNVGRQPAERARPGDVDVTGRALLHMIVFATFVTERRGRSFRRIDRGETGDRLMATAAVVTRRLLILPVTVETGVMRMRHGFEVSIGRRIPCSWGNQRNHVPAVIRLVTERAVVVIGFLLVVGLWFEERRANKVHRAVLGTTWAQRRDHVLMFVVRKLDGELALVFRLRRLISTVRFAESEAPIFARRAA